jgi:hypothetical protein
MFWNVSMCSLVKIYKYFRETAVWIFIALIRRWRNVFLKPRVHLCRMQSVTSQQRKKNPYFFSMKWKEVGLLEYLVLCLRATYFNCFKILQFRREIRYEIRVIREHLTINISQVCHNTYCLLSCTQEQVTNGYPDQKNTPHRFRQHSFALNFGLFLLILPA